MENIEKMLNDLKKPSLNLIFNQNEIKNPNIESHLGGLPYLTEQDVWPLCKHCKNDMIFFLQINEKSEDKQTILNTFYHCPCKHDQYEPTITIKKYINPILDKAVVLGNASKVNEYVDINFEPSWSVPAWSTLKQYNNELYEYIIQINKNDIDLAEDYYDALRWNNNLIATEPYSLIGGYPEYTVEPKKRFNCLCCDEAANFVFQLDSDESLGLDWNHRVLYCFKCNNSETYYFNLS